MSFKCLLGVILLFLLLGCTTLLLRIFLIYENCKYKGIKAKRTGEVEITEYDNQEYKDLFTMDINYLLSNQTDMKCSMDSLLEMNEKDAQKCTKVDGYETTALALAFTMFLLGAHQDIQEKVIAELDQVLGPLPKDASPTLNQVLQMKYLESVLKESMRLFPPPGLIAKTTVGDIQIRNYTIPANTQVGVSIYHIHRNPSYYPDPHSFNPENFSEENEKSRHPYAYLPFSGGPRMCIGKKYAMLEMKVALAIWLRKYKVDSFEKPEDLMINQRLLLKPMNGIRVRISERK